MGNIFIFSLIAGLAISILLIPFSYKPKAKEKEGRKLGTGIMAATAAVSVLLVFAVYYFTSLDRNLTSLWLFAVIASVIGAVFATGRERMIKTGVFVLSLAAGAFFLTAFLFNADDKYESAKMKEKTEIETFDEKETPASVPPKFARNKMKKAFGQVPNTSYYELGSLRSRKSMENMFILRL